MFIYDDRYNQLEVDMELDADSTGNQVVNGTNHLIDEAISLLNDEIRHYYNEIADNLEELQNLVCLEDWQVANQLKYHIIKLFEKWSDWYKLNTNETPKVSEEQQQNDMLVYHWLYGRLALTIKDMEESIMADEQQTQNTEQLKKTVEEMSDDNKKLEEEITKMQFEKLTKEKEILENQILNMHKNLTDTQKKLESAETCSNIAIGLGVVSTIAAVGTAIYTICKD